MKAENLKESTGYYRLNFPALVFTIAPVGNLVFRGKLTKVNQYWFTHPSHPDVPILLTENDLKDVYGSSKEAYAEAARKCRVLMNAYQQMSE